MLIAELLRELLDYNPETGQFTWLQRRGRRKIGSSAGSKSGRGYCYIEIDGRAYRASRLAWLYVYGCWPIAEIDHINCDPADDRIANLREATRAQNVCNVRTSNAAGLKGVYRNGGGWSASIRKNRKLIYLGLFNSPEDAHAAYVEAATRLHGEFARVA